MIRARFPIALLITLMAGTWLLPDYKNAISLYKRQKFREALKELQPDISRYADWEFGHRLAGLCYFSLAEYDNAARAFERAAELKSTEACVYMGLGESYLKLGKPDRALAALEKGKQYCGKQSELYDYDRIRGFTLFDQGRYAEAADAVLQSFQHQSGSAGDYLLLGISYFKTGQPSKAKQALTAALQMKPDLNSAQSYLDRVTIAEGENALKEKNYSLAHDIFTAVLAKQPEQRTVRLNLALTEIGLKNWAAAEDNLRALEPAFPDSYKYWFYRGYALEKLNKLTDAERYYRKAFQTEPTLAARESLDRVLRKLGKR